MVHFGVRKVVLLLCLASSKLAA